MKIQLESTTKIVNLDGVDCRVWEGVTESGIPVHCFIALIASNSRDQRQFAYELQETRPPSPEIAAIPARLIL